MVVLLLGLWLLLGCDNTKEKLGGVILKSLSFGTGCPDFAKKTISKSQNYKVQKVKAFKCMFAIEKKLAIVFANLAGPEDI